MSAQRNDNAAERGNDEVDDLGKERRRERSQRGEVPTLVESHGFV
jgi:hypothetical protein